MRFFRFIVAIIVAPSLGCVTLTPVGPFSSKFTSMKDPPATMPAISPETPLPHSTRNAMHAESGTKRPVIKEAPPPPRPSFLVSPEDVNTNNANQVLRNLAAEIEQDRKSTGKIVPVAEVSTISMGGR